MMQLCLFDHQHCLWSMENHFVLSEVLVKLLELEDYLVQCIFKVVVNELDIGDGISSG